MHRLKASLRRLLRSDERQAYVSPESPLAIAGPEAKRTAQSSLALGAQPSSGTAKAAGHVFGTLTRRPHHPILLLLFLLCASGCRAMGPPAYLVAYDGPRKAPSEVAKVVGAGDSFASELIAGGFASISRVSILEVDGREQRIDATTVRPLEWVEVLPGRHEVMVFMRVKNPGMLGYGASRTETAPVTLSFRAEAGRTYVVCGSCRLSPPDIRFWIVDQATGALVAGRKP